MITVATVPTVYGIETARFFHNSNLIGDGCNSTYRLRYWNIQEGATNYEHPATHVATVPTVYGIETEKRPTGTKNYIKFVATVPTVYGIETGWVAPASLYCFLTVATVPTVYGIETRCKKLEINKICCCNSTYRLRYWNFS